MAQKSVHIVRVSSTCLNPLLSSSHFVISFTVVYPCISLRVVVLTVTDHKVEIT